MTEPISELPDVIHQAGGPGIGSPYLYATYIGPGTRPGTSDIQILGQTVTNIPKLAHIEGQYIGYEVFTSNGTFTKANYPGLGSVVVELVGGGGGSGGCTGSSSSTVGGVGGGGGGGAYAMRRIAASDIPDSVTVTVGAGGTAASAGNNNGGNGGTSSFGNLLSAEGGRGGNGAAASSGEGQSSGIGGVGGESGSNFDLLITGDDGHTGIRIGPHSNGNLQTLGGGGGGSYFGGERRASTSLSANGIAGKSYGGGASGAQAQGGSSTSRAGAAGAPGVVIVHLYTGLVPGQTVLCLRTPMVPLLIVGAVVGSTVPSESS